MIRKIIVLCGVVCLLAVLGLYHQPYYPVSWQDEGFVLQGAMNLVRYGKYAMLSSEGFRVLDQPLVANGPGVVLPIAVMFKAFGIGLLQARIMILLFMFWSVAMFFILAERLTGRTAACISLITLLSATNEGFLYYGRIALGNMPALAFLLTGFVFLLKWNRSRQLRYAALAGFFFGLSAVTKAQIALIIPALALAALLDQLYYRKTALGGYALMIAVIVGCMFLWNFAQYLIVGRENFANHLAAIQSSSRVTIFTLRPERILLNIQQFIISGMPIYFIPGLLWALWSMRQKTLESVSRFPFIFLSVLWLSWFVFFSIGWRRYFFDAAVIGILFSGKLVVDALETVKNTRKDTNRKPSKMHMAGLIFVGVLGLAVLLGLGENILHIFAPPDTALQRFSQYLSQNIPGDAVVESWEWQIDPLVNLNFHHPTNDWVDRMTVSLFFGEVLNTQYNFSEFQPEYVIDGPFSKGTMLYSTVLARGCCTLIYSDSRYDLYRVNTLQLDK